MNCLICNKCNGSGKIMTKKAINQFCREKCTKQLGWNDTKRTECREISQCRALNQLTKKEIKILTYQQIIDNKSMPKMYKGEPYIYDAASAPTYDEQFMQWQICIWEGDDHIIAEVDKKDIAIKFAQTLLK